MSPSFKFVVFCVQVTLYVEARMSEMDLYLEDSVREVA